MQRFVRTTCMSTIYHKGNGFGMFTKCYVCQVKQLIDFSLPSFQKFKDGNSSSELNSLKYTQKLIDLRLSYLQSNKSGWF